MTDIDQHSVKKHMHVYSSDKQALGQIAEAYPESFALRKVPLVGKERYYPYNLITAIDHDRVELQLTADEAEAKLWEKRPDYEDHPGDPLQLLYDRGHGLHDPFDETNPTKDS